MRVREIPKWEKRFEKKFGVFDDRDTWWRKDIDHQHKTLAIEYNKSIKKFIKLVLKDTNK